MKIISKFKDNYDFMVSKYGLDETLVYDRRNSTLVGADKLWRLDEGDKKEFERKLSGYRFIGGKFINWSKTDVNKLPRLLHSVIFVGKNLIHIFAAQGKIYTSLEFDETELRRQYQKDRTLSFSDGFRAHIVSRLSKVGEQATREEILQLVALEDDRKTTLKNIVRDDISKDEILSAPIVFFKLTQNIHTAAINPQLNAMGFYLDTDFVWQSLVEFLSAKKDASAPTGTIPNNIKIASKGFDVKRSFRPKMK
ncbi:MAG: hypothetical protein KH703_03365 [Campylobacter gracilis]|uniref:hypothetical protein n=1 Tax=Campylobacter gracilis TaxID=824 RepID=UPI0026F35C8B|nr:hypothetical protein [Campylobacter gracilis]MBS6152443.1 hypothetical protein [Campylobacter gracilis]